MDTGEYDTNSLLIDNISSIYFRVLELSTNLSRNFSSVLLEVETTLRNDGHLVYCDISRRAIWHFHVKDKNGIPITIAPDLDGSMEVSGHAFSWAEAGSLDLKSIHQARVLSQQLNYTPPSSSLSSSANDQPQRYGVPNTSQSPSAQPQDQDSKMSNIANTDDNSTQSPNKTIYKHFIAAVLLAVSCAFCRATGAVPLDHRTVLLSSDILKPSNSYNIYGEQYVALGTLRAYLTTAGALIMSLRISYCPGLTCVDNIYPSGVNSPGYSIVVAPFGVVAHDQPIVSDEAKTESLAPSPNTQQAFGLPSAPDFQETAWKDASLKLLHLRGIPESKLASCSWINVAFPKWKLWEAKRDDGGLYKSGAVATLPWPRSLCFRKKPFETSLTSRMGDTLIGGYEENHDPLGIARGWLTSTSEREEKVVKRRADRMAEASKDTNNADNRPAKPTSHSPLALRRPSTTVAGAMYPTPPDAIQNLSGVTPSVDGALSSPRNPLAAAVGQDIEPSIAIGIGSLDEASDLVESKQQRSDSNLLGDAENMFEDISGGMFDDNDITEADFNFFDEQPSDTDMNFAVGEINTLGEPTIEPVDAHEEPKIIPQATPPKPPLEQEVVVFAKPELRHARSSRNIDTSLPSRESRVSAIKRESSPFDPQTVFKRVKASLVNPSREPSQSILTSRRNNKIFEKVDFGATLPMISKKYEQGGHFDWDTTSFSAKPKRVDSTALPKTDYLKRHTRPPNKKSKGQPNHATSLLNTLTKLNTSTRGHSPGRVDCSVSDEEEDDDSSMGSGPDDTSYTSEISISPPRSSMKLAIPDDDVASQVMSARDTEQSRVSNQQLTVDFLALSNPESSEPPFSAFFADPELLSRSVPLGDHDFIQIAQIIAEQAATGNLSLSKLTGATASSSLAAQGCQSFACDARNILETLGDAVATVLGNAVPVRLKGLLDIQDVPVLGQPNWHQPRPIPGRDGGAESIRPSNLYQIPYPHLEVRRAEMKLSILPPAITFWESLGLAPKSGTKDVNAICVFPEWQGMVDSAKTFLGRLKSVYEVMKLGSFDKMPLSSDFENGILPYEVEKISTSPDTTMTGYGSSLVDVMETLREAVCSLTTTETNIVVYFVYSPKNPRTILEACTTFQRFFESYQKVLATRKEAAPNDVVLQLVSMDVLSSPTSLTITPTLDLAKLCMETYDRCTLFGGQMPAPAIVLEQPLPRSIDFKLSSSPSASLFRENSCMHVAYSQSVDDRWIAAAWTDDRGSQQATASYCTGRKGKPPSRSMNEIAHEIWESTLDFIAAWKVHWRIIITKCGPMDQQEQEFWVDLARTEIKASVTVVLMTVDTDPSLQLVAPAIKLPPPSTHIYTTPVSTPQANIVSPEQSATPATPARDPQAMVVTPGADTGGDADTESFLVDLSDQTWGAILGHRLNSSVSTLSTQSNLISGYLVKRTGTKTEDTPVLMEVNIVHTESGPRAYEQLLREMLSFFRGLGTLARARGMVERGTDVRPWHVAAAEKAARALYLLM